MRKTLGQLLRYGIVGLAANSLGYGLYFGLTYAGLGPKLAMSLLYVLGILQTFVFNKKWAFRHEGMHRQAFIRYIITYGIGYLINLLALFVLVDRLGFPHQIVQAVLIVIIALFLFMLQKLWVFRLENTSRHSEMAQP